MKAAFRPVHFSIHSLTLVLVLFSAIGSPHNLLAQDEERKLLMSTNVELQLSTIPEAKLLLSQSFGLPFLQGSGPLTRDNNIAAVLTAEISPLTVNGSAEINWTPAAFFVLSAGGKAGSGWNNSLGNGIGINMPLYSGGEFPRRAEIRGESFDGLIYHFWGAGTLQFDFAAIKPGDWNHLLFRTRQEFRYSAYTGACDDYSWVFENDDGENQNGFRYYANYLLAYGMPQSPLLNMVGIMAELEKTLYNDPRDDFWGGNLGYWIFSTVFNFSFAPRLNTTLAIQMQTRRNNGKGTIHNIDYYYKDLELQNDEGQRRLLFYRIALLFNYKIF